MTAWVRLRPTFQVELKESCADARTKLDRWFAQVRDDPLRMLHGEYGELHLPPSQHRLWSPHLSFHLCDSVERPTILGRFAPRLDIWTTVWIFYLVFAFTVFFALILACSQWLVGHYPWGFWIASVGFLLLVGLYLIAHLGQQWSSDQMVQLRSEFEQLLNEAGVRWEPFTPAGSRPAA